ncbi:AlpA family phage regulatory protein [Actinoplanes sp. NEAU-A12]|uniref:AlpA family phage regulatory protein n=1 Tax=Actinoplanes sandaracinus TaxID=3045177 RepID=A0ABT6WUZ3_9ACTN|nr:AlpA family phage regulatory protein [Actinoplanes sandaracinus]MDI6103545.1 AlpA family phage regulatory protein [Actinoplanes sandaracinus]
MASSTLRLLGAHEIRTQIGEISRQRVYQLARRPDFPRPVAELAQGKVWLAEEVEAWLEARRIRLDTPRHPGEP